MSILVNKNSRVITQGMTGKTAIKGKDHEEDAAEEVVTKETEETYEDAQ